MSELNLLPCPFCGGQPKIHTLNLDERFAYANEVKVQCPSCGCTRGAVGDTSKPGYADNSTTEQRAIAAWNRRSAPLVGDDGLPPPAAFCVADENGRPLFSKGWMFGPVAILNAQLALYTAEQVRQAQRDVVAADRAARGYNDAIQSVIACAQRVYSKFGADSDWSEWKDLGNALADLSCDGGIDRAARAQQQAQSVGDDPEFRELLADVQHEPSCRMDSEDKALIAYIDGRTAGAAPDELIEIGNRMATTLEVLATALKNPGTADGVRCTVNEWRAAAPSPQHGKEGA